MTKSTQNQIKSVFKQLRIGTPIFSECFSVLIGRPSFDFLVVKLQNEISMTIFIFTDY